MPRRQTQVLPVNGFVGGINLRADAFQLRGHESPDMLNVDVDPSGGFGLRKPVGLFSSVGAFDQAPHSIFGYVNRAGVKQVLVGYGERFAYSSGTTWLPLTTSANVELLSTVSTVARAALFQNQGATSERLYIQNGTDQVRFWDGTNDVAAALGVAFADDYAVPGAAPGDMPIAQYIQSHNGYLWVANTLETAVRYPNRVRFSHPNKPESWRTNDYIDIDPADGDEITGIVSHFGNLYIFKNRSIHTVGGYGPSSFTPEKLVDSIGAVSQEAIVATDQGIYFYSFPEGLFMLQGTRVRGLMERLRPAITDGRIPQAYAPLAKLGWVNQRLWMSVPWTSTATVNSRTFVFDPTLGDKDNPGAFVPYDIGFLGFLAWNPGGQAVQHLGLRADQWKVLALDQSSGGQDSLGIDFTSLTGAATSYVSAPDSAALSVTGDLTLDAKVMLDDWTPAAANTIIAKYTTTGNQRSYRFSVLSDGKLQLTWSTDGTATITQSSTASNAFVDGTTGYVRVILDVTNGAQYEVKFYTSTDGNTWVQLGATVTGATGPTSIFDSTAVATIGAHTSGTEPLSGYVYWAKIWAGDDDATRVLKGYFNPSAVTSLSATTYTDTTGAIWTLAADATFDWTRDEDITSYYVTRWFDNENAAMVKKWKRPDFVVDGDSTLTLQVQTFLDYTPEDIKRTFTISPTADETYLVWDDGSHADNMKWYDGTTIFTTWTRTESGGSQEILRGSNIGRGRAVQLKVIGPTPTSVAWSVNAINFKFIPKRIR